MILESDIKSSNKIAQLKNHIGNTPLYELKSFSFNPKVKIYAKLEWMQFGGSVKSRPAYQIIADAVKKGQLHDGKTLLDASSGNTAIAYASIAANLGIKVAISLPQTASQERKNLLKALGAEIIYTSKLGNMEEAQEIVHKLAEERPDKYFLANQYGNDNNWMAHYINTGHEVWNQTKGKVTHFVAGLGTTGSFMGTTRALKTYDAEIKFTALQPVCENHGLHGWKHMPTSKIPTIYDSNLPDEFRYVEKDEAYKILKLLAEQEGLMIGPTGAANLAGALKLAEELNEGTIVTLFPDNAEKYDAILEELF
jgi:cysteine synthase B